MGKYLRKKDFIDNFNNKFPNTLNLYINIKHLSYGMISTNIISYKPHK